MEKLYHFTQTQLNNYLEIGVSIFLAFFLYEGYHIHQLNFQNKKMLSEISAFSERSNASSDELIGRIHEFGNLKESFRLNNERAKPLIKLMQTYDVENGNLSSFLDQIGKQCNSEEIYGFDNSSFSDLDPLLADALDYPGIKGYVFSKAYREFTYRLSSRVGVLSGCYLWHPNIFTIVETVGDKYHFYSGNVNINPQQSYISINGDVLRGDDYIWKPTRRGMHFFDVEYVGFSFYKVHKKKFRVGLKVI